jgi:hypothetical protein
LNVSPDAFSSGQIGSKIWLCEELEKLFSHVDVIWIYGGWYGMTAFLLQSRGNIQIRKVRSYDLDPDCEAVADMINENWVIDDWKFKASTQDCNLLDLGRDGPDLVINTSTEHFDSLDWWHNIPKGTVVALQGNNMPHDDHVVHTDSLEDFVNQYSLSEVMYKGQLEFQYPSWKFTRYMLIGKK